MVYITVLLGVYPISMSSMSYVTYIHSDVCPTNSLYTLYSIHTIQCILYNLKCKLQSMPKGIYIYIYILNSLHNMCTVKRMLDSIIKDFPKVSEMCFAKSLL